MISEAGNLPVALTSFVGRRRDLADVRRLLGTTRLLTLVGMGGVGKTRLALEVAAASRKAFPDGVWLVDLAPVRDPSTVADATAVALGVPDRSARSTVDQLTRHLSGRRTLIVLDNCEHLIHACAELADTLLSAAAGLRILATSRQSLGIVGEHTLVVPPLSVPDEAIELLRDRAAAVRPELRITEANRAGAFRLCTDLEGLPLAIELAASRLRTLTVDQTIDRLEDRFALLTGGSRTALPRQRTLRAMIDWSYELCSPAERLLWNRLSVFSGGFCLDGAEDVCSGDGIDRHEVLDLLDGLVAQSVVLPTEEEGLPRYRLLETIRQYGRARLAESAEEQRVLRRHRGFCLHLAGLSAWGPRQEQARVRLRAEHSNLLAALDHGGDPQGELALAAALRFHWCVGGFLGEGRRRLDQALTAAPEPTAARAWALWVAAWVALLQGDHETADRRLAEADELSRQLDDPAIRTLVMGLRGTSALFQGRPEEAVSLCERAVAQDSGAAAGAGGTRGVAGPGAPGGVASPGGRGGGTGPGGPGAVAGPGGPDGAGGAGEAGGAGGAGAVFSLFQLTVARAYLEDPRARETGLRAVALAEARGEREGLAHALGALGLASWVCGDPEEGTARFRAGLTIYLSFGDHLGVALMLEALAWVAASRGDHRRAGRLLGTARAMWRHIGTTLSVFGPHKVAYHTRCEQAVLEALGPAAFERALADGERHDSLAQAAAYALADDADTGTGTGTRADTGSPVTGAAAGPLTRREREVAAMVAQGMTNRQIAAALVLSPRTVGGHVRNILAKLGHGRRAQIATWWAANQVPDPSE
ncbi:AAA family ATPase [Streptomyces phaeolivaceus]|uniref:AAA family ATPase n=1 Tax=Streptomyces phaeolivaceus TaxID=2653200 RepID=A0A5P8KI96_9ACTN|nr:AAA family ATPase [Streptomyces phaeolivaceus]